MQRTKARTLCIVPTRALLSQWLGAVDRGYQASVGCLGDGARQERAITVATFESAYRSAERIGPRFDLLVVDEAHHFGRGVRDEALEMCIAPDRLGLTATPAEAEGHAERLRTLIGPVVFELTVDDLAGSYLASYRTVPVMVELSVQERHRYMSDMAAFRPVMAEFQRLHPSASWPEFVAFASRTDVGRNALSAFRRSRTTTDFNEGKLRVVGEILARHTHAKVLIFTSNNDAAYAIARRYLIMPMTCDIGRDERRDALELFARGELRCLVSAQVLNEGIDVPDAEIGIVVGGAHGKREHVQRLGRLLRPTEGKCAVLYELITRDTSETRRASRRARVLATRTTPSLQSSRPADHPTLPRGE